MSNFSDLVGQTLLHVEAAAGNDVARFVLSDGRAFKMLHHQDCCEGVELVDICGDIADLVDAVVLDAREETSDDQSGKYESATWTFYILQTDKGAVTLRWLGTSNGYYSEGVSMEVDTLTDRERALIQARKLEADTAKADRRRVRVRL